MKKILTILFLSTTICNAQSPIKPLADDNIEIANAYYKDLNNELDTYVGTWKYVNGSSSLTIVIQKKIMQFIDGAAVGSINNYEDILIGEYQYVENGIEKINTLSQLSIQQAPDNYHINGNALIYPGSQFCQQCTLTDRKVMLAYTDAANVNTGYWAYMFLQRADSGSTQKLKMKLVGQAPLVKDENDTSFTGFIIPEGSYLLEKQP